MTMRVLKNNDSYGLAMNGMDLLTLLPFEVTEAIEQLMNGADGEEIEEFFDSSSVLYLSAKDIIDVSDKDITEVFETAVVE